MSPNRQLTSRVLVTAACLACLVSTTPALGQTTKGMTEVGGQASLSSAISDESDDLNLLLIPFFNYFTTDRFALGGRVMFSGTRFSDPGGGESSFTWFSYLFGTATLHLASETTTVPFIGAGVGFSLLKLDSGLAGGDDTLTGASLNLNGGFKSFITQDTTVSLQGNFDLASDDNGGKRLNLAFGLSHFFGG